jgi:uncharacterized protein
MGNQELIIASSKKPAITTSNYVLKEAYLSEIRPQIQVTLNCNLACDYCFQDHNGPVMKLETASVIIDQLVTTFYSPLKVNNKQNKLDIYWHGGEPLIAGIRFFEGIIEIQKMYPKVHFVNHVQTNGTLMTEKLAIFFVKHKFMVGFSLDGPKSIHDTHRLSKKGAKPTFDKAMNGIKLYQKHAKLDKVPIMMVVTVNNVKKAAEIYEFFYEIGADVGIDIYDVVAEDLNISEPTKEWDRGLAPSTKDIEEFLTYMFDQWFHDTTTRRVNFRELKDEVMLVLEHQRNSDRGNESSRDPFHKKRCHFTRTIFGYDGHVYSCDQYINDEKSSLGNIHQHLLADIVMGKARLWETIKQQIRGVREQNKFACPSCEWASDCAGGCMTCMKYNSLLLNAREQGLEDNQWTELTEEPTPLDSIYGEFYYCSGLINFRNHVRKTVLETIENEKL